jgi:hypothetical protein
MMAARTALRGSPPRGRRSLEPICDDLRAQGFTAAEPRTLDGDPITGPRKPLNSGVFTAKVNRHAQTPGAGRAGDLYADSVDLGHPGRLATVFCGFKAKVHLRPGKHTIVVDYSGAFGGASTVFTYNIKVGGHHRSH